MKMAGKTALITGSTDGVGRYVAARLAAAVRTRRIGKLPFPKLLPTPQAELARSPTRSNGKQFTRSNSFR
jgi:hypothetical protein